MIRKVQIPRVKQYRVEDYGNPGGDFFGPEFETVEIETDENGVWIDPETGKAYVFGVDGAAPDISLFQRGPLDRLPTVEEFIS